MKKTTEKTNSRSTQNKTENANTQNAKNKSKGGCGCKSTTKNAKDCS